MIKASIITALCIPVLSAATLTDYSAAITNTRQQADNWQNNLEQVEADLQSLGVELTAPGSEAEIPETEDTVAVADQGLLFDTANSRIIYLGNVRLRDARAHLNAAAQLHIYLQDFRDNTPAETAPPPLANAAKTEGVDAENAEAATGSATEPDSEATAQAPVMSETSDGAIPASTNAKTDEGGKPQGSSPAPPCPESGGVQAATEQPAESEGPAVINTHSAIADSINNAVLLYAPAAGQDIHMQQGQNCVRITPASDAAARILADPEGNILLEGGIVDLKMVDREGRISTLKTTGGLVYYHASTHTLHAPGASVFTHPDGSLACTESLEIVLKAAESKARAKEGFMSQFTALRFEGITTATAKGQVVLTGIEQGERPAMRAEGDTLTYHGETGECSLEGSKCRLTYGNYDVLADEGLHLLANGDIELRGKNIHGTYERESGTPGQMLSGNFKANAHVIFKADTGIITTAKGIFMQDDEMDFSCTGPAQLELTPKEGAKELEQKSGMPNLAITRYGAVSRAKATGNVTAHQYEAGTRKCLGELKAATVDTDMVTGETLLTSEPGAPLIALYEGNRLVATPKEGQVASMQMLANGDLMLSGDTINARLENQDGTTTAKCRDYVRLIRAEDRLETGSSTELHAPTAILTTNSSLSAKLASSGKERKAPTPGKKGIGRFQFDYTGIQEATTDAGCTLRTEQGSMQCTGPVHIVMEPEGAGKSAEMGGIKYATATGDVAIAGKDSSGRLMRATGDHLKIDSSTGMKVLSGKRVTLSDANNTHIITGKGAAISIDARNNVKITGSSHKTHATNVRQQLNGPQNKKSKK